MASVIFIPRITSTQSDQPLSPDPISPHPKTTSPFSKTAPPLLLLQPEIEETPEEELNATSQQQTGKITRQIIRNLPPIPKFRALSSYSPFPLVRRCSALSGRPPPRLLSLDLFNPETDDLNSDSSEQSSADSIDSVVSALAPPPPPPPPPPPGPPSYRTATTSEMAEFAERLSARLLAELERQPSQEEDHTILESSPDSPSAGGASTHHRYYHVFREGELDALISRHVASLHIVSSYYERASWCVVAEKVQVWTI